MTISESPMNFFLFLPSIHIISLWQFQTLGQSNRRCFRVHSLGTWSFLPHNDPANKSKGFQLISRSLVTWEMKNCITSMSWLKTNPMSGTSIFTLSKLYSPTGMGHLHSEPSGKPSQKASFCVIIAHPSYGLIEMQKSTRENQVARVTTEKEWVKLSHHEPIPSKHGTWRANGSNFVKSMNTMKPSGISLWRVISILMSTVPGNGISSGNSPLLSSIRGFSNPSINRLTIFVNLWLKK